MIKNLMKQLEEAKQIIDNLANEKWSLYSQIHQLEGKYASLKSD